MRTGLVKIIITAFILSVTTLWNGAGAQQLMSNLTDDSVAEIYNMEIEDLMEVDIRTGKPGWFETQLEQLRFEPVVRYDQASLDDGTGHDIKRSTIGLIYYPNPELHPIFNFRISQDFVHDDGTGDSKHEFVAQCVIGF